MLIVLKVYLVLAEAGFEPLIVCILLVPPPWNFLCSYWLVSALHPRRKRKLKVLK